MLPEDVRSAERAVFERAMANIKRYWAGVTYAKEIIGTTATPSGSPDSPFGDFDHVDKILSSSATRMREDREMYNEYLFSIRHMDRRIGMVIFAKCTDSMCLDCLSNRPVANEML